MKKQQQQQQRVLGLLPLLRPSLLANCLGASRPSLLQAQQALSTPPGEPKSLTLAIDGLV